MARPTKIGIDYFSLDVDIFEDEKVIPVSSAFGPKGECIIIRVLCAIYRNGYFAECSEAFRFKIAKQANLPESLVSEVIAGLVKWGFFDKAVFDSFSVLTSKRIQKNWKEATRKRIPKNNLDYWILGVSDKNSGFPAEETPINQTESTQSKLKESKVNERKHSYLNPEVEKRIYERADIPMAECKVRFIQDEEHLKQLEPLLHTNREDILKNINEYFSEQIGRGFMRKSLLDAKSHFYHWYLKKHPHGTTTNKTTIYDA